MQEIETHLRKLGHGLPAVGYVESSCTDPLHCLRESLHVLFRRRAWMFNPIPVWYFAVYLQKDAVSSE